MVPHSFVILGMALLPFTPHKLRTIGECPYFPCEQLLSNILLALAPPFPGYMSLLLLEEPRMADGSLVFKTFSQVNA